METIMIKVPDGTKARLRKINGNVSALLRQQINDLFERRKPASAYEKSADLCGIIKGGPRNAATSKEYLKQYATKDSD